MALADQVLFALTLVALLGSGLMAGAFFAFSTFVMRALSRLPAGEGIAAMQAINVAVINPLFLGAFLGTGALSVAAIAAAWMRWGKPGTAYLLAGGILYLLGTFFVTVLCNVPLNNSLAAVAPADPEGARHWVNYVSRWTAWNHVRTAAALLAACSFAMAFRHLME
ncbi:MAG TPA: anthrone oxygenase family protein [Thermoanaerobaculia bacterium]